MSGVGPGRFPDFERQINDSLKEVALELRSVDVIDLASYIHTLEACQCRRSHKFGA